MKTLTTDSPKQLFLICCPFSYENIQPCSAKHFLVLYCSILSIITLMSQELYIRHRQRVPPKWEATFGSKDLFPELPWPGEVRLGWFWTAPGHTSLCCDRHITTLEKTTAFLQTEVFHWLLGEQSALGEGSVEHQPFRVNLFCQ